jgi:hypothetical protein
MALIGIGNKFSPKLCVSSFSLRLEEDDDLRFFFLFLFLFFVFSFSLMSSHSCRRCRSASARHFETVSALICNESSKEAFQITTHLLACCLTLIPIKKLGVNFTNILRAAFAQIFLCQKKHKPKMRVQKTAGKTFVRKSCSQKSWQK